MSDLTDLATLYAAYISQQNSSERLYRLYVDELMQEKEDEIEEIRI